MERPTIMAKHPHSTPPRCRFPRTAVMALAAAAGLAAPAGARAAQRPEAEPAATPPPVDVAQTARSAEEGEQGGLPQAAVQAGPSDPRAAATTAAAPGSQAPQEQGVTPPPINPETGLPTFEETMVVEGQDLPRYGDVEVVAGVTRTGAALRDVPQSVQVVPREVLEDRQATDLTALYANVSGLSSFSIYNDFTARGFRTGDNNLLVDGLRGTTAAWHVPASLVTLERVEVLKGPASVLFGAAEPGATVNLVRKAPLQTAAHSVRLSAGSFETFQGTLDSGGPLSRDGRLSYRLTMAAESAGSFRDHIWHKSATLAPVLGWRSEDEATRLTLGAEFLVDNRAVGWDRGLTAPGGALEALPIARFLHEPDDYDRNRGGAAHLTLERRLWDSWALHAQVRYSLRTERNGYHEPLRSGVLEDGRTLPREYRHFDDNQAGLSTGAWVAGDVHTGPLRHRVVAGADFNHFEREYLYRVARGAQGVAPIDIFEPVYGTSQRTGWRSDNTENDFARYLGVYLQDQVDVTPWLKVMGALRHERAHASSRWVDNTTGEGDPDYSDASAWVPRAGLVLQPNASTALFAGYSHSFQPQYSNHPEAGGPFDPERARQWEVGLKQELLQGKLSVQLAAYTITKQNVLMADPAAPERLRQTGRVLSRGLELDLIGQPVAGLSLLANWAVNDARVVEGAEGTVGQRLPNAPKHVGGVWGRYDFQQGGLLAGVGLGAGLRYVGKRATPAPDFDLPAHTLVGAAVYYKRGKMQVALNVDNVLNARHYMGAYDLVRIFPGAPLSAQLTLTQGF